MKIQKTYVKSVGPYQTGMFIELENWISPKALLKELHQDNQLLDIEECYIKMSIYIDEKENNTLVPNILLFVPCTKVEFV